MQMALEMFLLWHDSYMQAEVSFFHPSTHEQGEWIHDQQYHAEICNRKSQDLEQFIDGLIYRQLCNAFEWYPMEYPTSHLYFLKPFGVCIPRKYKWQVGYSMVYQQKALHNYCIPCRRKYRGIEARMVFKAKESNFQCFSKAKD